MSDEGTDSAAEANPYATKDHPYATKDNPYATKDFPLATEYNPYATGKDYSKIPQRLYKYPSSDRAKKMVHDFGHRHALLRHLARAVVDS